VAEVRERLSVNKQRPHRFHIKRFNLEMLKEVEGKEKYHVKASNRFAAFENLDAEMEIHSTFSNTSLGLHREYIIFLKIPSM
jgi:hypothetical protein